VKDNARTWNPPRFTFFIPEKKGDFRKKGELTPDQLFAKEDSLVSLCSPGFASNAQKSG
jgi:hypothetical protein